MSEKAKDSTASEHTKDLLSCRNRCLMSCFWSSSLLNQVSLGPKARVTLAFVSSGDRELLPSVGGLTYKLSRWAGKSENGFLLYVGFLPDTSTL